MINAGKPWTVQEAYQAVIRDERRNRQIAQDVKACIEAGHSPLLLTQFRDHAAELEKMLQDCADHVFLLQGGRNTKDRDAIRSKMQSVPANESVLLIAIGKYIGEGFNFPRLDTLMLATPISWEGNVEQYAGRLHRAYAGKTEVTIYDYVDSQVRVLEHMFYKRLRTYRKIGYEIAEQPSAVQAGSHGIYDAHEIRGQFDLDIMAVQQELIIASPGINRERTQWLLKMLPSLYQKNVRITIYTLAAEQYPEARQEVPAELIRMMKDQNIWVEGRSELYEHFAILDRKIVWYGSANLMSGPKEEDNMIRIIDPEVCRSLLESIMRKGLNDE